MCGIYLHEVGVRPLLAGLHEAAQRCGANLRKNFPIVAITNPSDSQLPQP